MNNKQLMLLCILALLPLTAPLAAGWVLVEPPYDEDRHATLQKALVVMRLMDKHQGDEQAVLTDKEYPQVNSAEVEFLEKFITAGNNLATLRDTVLLLHRMLLGKDSPVSEWRHMRAFDSAKACEHHRVQLVKDINTLLEVGWKSVDAVSTTQNAVLKEKASIEAARCVPASALY